MKKHWFFVVLLAVVIHYFRTKPTSIVNVPDGNYDFIIVGGGTAGCLLASFLSEDTNIKILLVESGNQFGYISNIPIAPTLLQRTKYDWSFETVPQKYSSYGLHDKKQFIPRGKGLGGSGQINYMLHGSGLPKDFDKWVEMGAHGWGSNDFKELFKNLFTRKKSSDSFLNKLYNFFSITSEPKKKKIYLSDIDDELIEITKSLKDAVEEIVNVTANSLQSTIHNGIRTSTFNTFLSSALRRQNLHILLNSTVSKIVFRAKTAYGVDIQFNGRTVRVLSKNEIIISAGSLKTPQLLLLSGIGPEEYLKELNIPVISAAAGVGRNLHDHLNTPLYISIEKPFSMTVDKIQTFNSVYQYFLYGTGFWSVSVHQYLILKDEIDILGYLASPGITANVNVGNESSLILFTMGSVDEKILRGIANTNKETFRAQFPFYQNTSQEGFLLLSHCMQPHSRGTVKLLDLNPNSPPLIDPNYLSDKRDIRCIIKGIRTVEKLMNTISFTLIKAKIQWPMLSKCIPKFTEKAISDDYLECIIRHGGLTGHHLAGTCSMAGENRVVDSSLKVVDVNKLRIVDASIFPTPITSFPNSVVVAAAYKAVKIIKEEYNLNIEI